MNETLGPLWGSRASPSTGNAGGFPAGQGNTLPLRRGPSPEWNSHRQLPLTWHLKATLHTWMGISPGHRKVFLASPCPVLSPGDADPQALLPPTPGGKEGLSPPAVAACGWTLALLGTTHLVTDLTIFWC